MNKYQERGGDWYLTIRIGNRDYEWKMQALRSKLRKCGDTVPNSTIHYYERQISLNEYRIEHHISPNEDYSIWGFVNDTSLLIDFAGLFTIIIAASIVASEFNWGTIKLLLIRPIRRGKILAAKYISVLLFGLLVLSILFVFSALLGALLFGFPNSPSPYLSYYHGVITEQNMLNHLLIYYGLKSISMFMLATMAFMISAVFRNSSLAIGLSLFLMFTGGQVTQFIALKFTWAKYILFANTDLIQYFDGMPMVDGMTLTFSVTMLVIYFFLFLILAHFVFKQRDVAS